MVYSAGFHSLKSNTFHLVSSERQFFWYPIVVTARKLPSCLQLWNIYPSKNLVNKPWEWGKAGAVDSGLICCIGVSDKKWNFTNLSTSVSGREDVGDTLTLSATFFECAAI